jgi:hypothetical protein
VAFAAGKIGDTKGEVADLGSKSDLPLQLKGCALLVLKKVDKMLKSNMIGK